MPNAYYLVDYDRVVCASRELAITAVARGERAFMNMLSRREMIGKPLFDQVVYPVSGGQKDLCDSYAPIKQNFDSEIKCFNILSKEVLEEIKAKKSSAFPTATVIAIGRDMIGEIYAYRRFNFFRVKDYKEAQKYRMLKQMASVKICGSLYIALDAVDVRAERPIIATLKD